MKKIAYVLLTIVILGIGGVLLIPTSTPELEGSEQKGSNQELPIILGSETFNQSDDDYLVYFYQDNCYYCQQLKPTIESAQAAGMKIYAVDMAAEENEGLLYDWEAHHEEYDVEIGEIVDGERVLYEGVSESDYTSSDWAIQDIDGKVVATHNTPYANFNPTSADEIGIIGTPVLIHINNGKSVKMTTGYSESDVYLKDLIEENN